jgi:hypothetical protein
MATTLRKPSVSYPTDTAFGQLLDRYYPHFTKPAGTPTKRSPDESPITRTAGEPVQQAASQTELKPPFESILMERGIAVTVARELLQENQQLQQANSDLAVKAEKYDRYRQQTKDSYLRQKDQNHEELKRKQRKYKSAQRARDKQKPQRQENDTSR